MSERRPRVEESQSSDQMGNWIAIGAGLGTAFGVIYGNIAIGVALGVALGVVIGAVEQSKARKG
ncbi:MAG: hypothetical protein U1E29_15980 [Coriobacteriia bacterium]|nr:hypothetical protein [Coriobacteriia bacterium]